MKQIRLFYILLIAPLFSSGQNIELAEIYYDSAFKILNLTSHGGLSRELSLKALDFSNKAIDLNSQISKYFRVKGTSYFYLQNYEFALENHGHAILLDSTNYLAWMGAGIVFENTHRFELAEKYYLKALKYDSNSISIYNNLGLLYTKWNKNEQSMKAFDKAIQINPNYSGSYIGRGERKREIGMFKEAISDFSIAIQLDSIDKISYNNRGLCKFYVKDYESAISDFEKALSIDLGNSFDENFDTDKYSYNNIANSYFGLGNIEKACEYWKIAIQKGYLYKVEWKKMYNIDDPKDLIKKHCK